MPSVPAQEGLSARGLSNGRLQGFLTAAGMVAVVTAMLIGGFAGLLCSVLFNDSRAPALGVGALVALAALRTHRVPALCLESRGGRPRALGRGKLMTAGVPAKMRAVVLDGPGPPEALAIRELPVPRAERGWVLVRVLAFGLNRSELHTRLGLAQGVTFPRVLGIEATGVVAACPGGEFSPGEQVMAMMGGMGRVFDGGYAEYTCVPVGQVLPFRSDLNGATLGAVPEMLQTSYGSLTVGWTPSPESRS
jgi:hypothetical protein